MAVRKYIYNRETDLGDVELDERMAHRTESVHRGRKQAGSVKHHRTRHGRRKKLRVRSRS